MVLMGEMLQSSAEYREAEGDMTGPGMTVPGITH
jgi:hypothetical protein